jgi:hypothetical protein
MNGMHNPNYILLLNTVVVTGNCHAVEKNDLLFIDAIVTIVSIKMSKFERCTSIKYTYFLNAFLVDIIVPVTNFLQVQICCC